VTTRDEAIQRAAQALADCRARIARMTPEEQAAAAYLPGGPSVEELTARLRAERGATTRAANAA
jgi:hypothetical protein